MTAEASRGGISPRGPSASPNPVPPTPPRTGEAPPVILPGATLGVLGSGQLGRMFAIAARRLGYRVHTYSPDRDTPTGQVADVETCGAYDDIAAVRQFARGVSVVTFEFENVPAAAAEVATQETLVRPAGSVLHTTQNRLREKRFLQTAGFPVTEFRPVSQPSELEQAVRELGCPAILKTAGWGYDGKGQVRLQHPDEIPAAWTRLGGQPAVLEAVVDFTAELSVVGARGVGGECVTFPVFENHHEHHILDVTLCPARIPVEVQEEARRLTCGILERLEVVGVLCVEFFWERSGRLLVNELAPRPHNSGHLTLDACVSCQFEQQVRAVCGLPLGATDLLRPAAMLNLLGDVWEGGEPDWSGALSDSWVKLHLYGKLEPRAGRKMGHLTALGDTLPQALERGQQARSKLRRSS